MIPSMCLKDTLGAIEGRPGALEAQFTSGVLAGQPAGSADAPADGASSPGPAEKAKAFPIKPVVAGRPPPHGPSVFGSWAAPAGPACCRGPALRTRAESSGSRQAQRAAAEMTGVWIGGIAAERTRVALVWWSAAEV